MKSFLPYLLILTLLLAYGQPLRAGNAENALKQLNAGNYAQARTYLEKGSKSNPADYAINYLWACYYMAEENTLKNVDSAYYRLAAALAVPDSTIKEKVVRKNALLGIRPYTMQKLLDEITAEAYTIADSTNTVAGWEHFLSLYPHSPRVNEAMARRNEEAFKQAQQSFTYESFKQFLEQYPNADQIPEALELYENLLFQEMTRAGTWQSYLDFTLKHPESRFYAEAKAQYEKLFFAEMTAGQSLREYLNFIAQYPNSPYVPTAEDKVYELETREHTILAYTNFVSRYPRNRNIGKAWSELYDLYNFARTAAQLEMFKNLYPNYPNPQQIADDLRFAQMNILLDEFGGKFGYVDSASRQVLLPPQYPDAYQFSEGLAAVALVECEDTCLYGYINPKGEVVITPQFADAGQFHQGLALVSVGNCDDGTCKWGFIDRKGRPVVPIAYDDAITFNEGYSLVRVGKAYGFVNTKGQITVPLTLADAYSFTEGLAAYRTDTLWGFMDTMGQTIVQPLFLQVKPFSEGLAAVQNTDGKWGYITPSGTWAIPAQYDAADPFINNRAKVLTKQKKKNVWETVELTIDKDGKEVN